MRFAGIIDTAVEVLIWLILARSILSFIPHDPYKPVWRFIYDITEPMLKPFRRFSLGGSGFGMDFSPLIVILLLQFVIRPVLLMLLGMF